MLAVPFIAIFWWKLFAHFFFIARMLHPHILSPLILKKKPKSNFTLSNTNYEDPITDHILIDPIVSSSNQKFS